MLDASTAYSNLRNALRNYDDARASHGVTATAWVTIAHQLRQASVDLYRLADAVSVSRANSANDRALDAVFNARRAARMVEIAARGNVLEVAS